MTVAQCLDYCSQPGPATVPGAQGGYPYAGLEWSKECWCSIYLSSLSNKLDDSQCNLPCVGNTSEFCGAALKYVIHFQLLHIVASVTPPAISPEITADEVAF